MRVWIQEMSVLLVSFESSLPNLRELNEAVRPHVERAYRELRSLGTIQQSDMDEVFRYLDRGAPETASLLPFLYRGLSALSRSMEDDLLGVPLDKLGSLSGIGGQA